MEKPSWSPSWIRGGRIEDIVWLSNDVLAWTCGRHILFLDADRKSQRIYRCTDHGTGDGAHCVSCHPRLPVFAFSEKSSNPRILVLSYPSMQRISECSKGSLTGYLATGFTGHDLIVSVASYPKFQMIIWSWRTGERVHTVEETFIRDEVGQILRINQLGPIVVAQMGRSCGRLYTWEVHVAGKAVAVKDHEIKLPKSVPIYSIDWRPTPGDPLLAITDKDGHIFLSNLDGTRIRRVVLSQRCGVCQEIERPMVRWFRDGIILRTTFCQVRFFRSPKDPTGSWHRLWYVKSSNRPCVLATSPRRTDRFFYHTLEGHLMMVNFPDHQATPIIREHHQHGSVFRFLDFVYPWCHHLVALDDTKELAVLDSYKGTEVSRLDLDIVGDLSLQASHPDCPLVVLVTRDGEIVLVSILDPSEPRIVFNLKLRNGPLDLIKFSSTGRHLLVGEKETGNCFCLSVHPDQPISVKTQLKGHRRICDALLFDADRSLRVLLLQVGAKQFCVGQQLILFDLEPDQDLVTEVQDVLDLPGVYRELWHLPGSPKDLVGSVYLTRHLRVQRVKDFKDIVLTDATSTGHLARLASLYVDRRWIVSTGLDGLVFVRDRSGRRVAASLVTHHRKDFGAVKAIANPSCDVIVVLGYDGSVVAMNLGKMTATKTCLGLDEYDPCEIFNERIKADYESLDPRIRNLLDSAGQRKDPDDPEESEDPEDPERSKARDEIWEEARTELRAKAENERWLEAKTSVLTDLDQLKAKLARLLDENESRPDIERLPVSSFDLDRQARDRKLKSARDDREDLRLSIEHEIGERERISGWIRETFWDRQTVLGRSLFTIYTGKEVTNYPSGEEDRSEAQKLQWAQFLRETAKMAMESDTFQPWRRYDKEDLRLELSKGAQLHRTDRRVDFFLDEEEAEDDQRSVEEDRAMDGTIAHRFLDQTQPWYSQMESYGLGHVVVTNRFLAHDCHRLRQYFNKVFEEVRGAKEREMSLIRERIDKIRYIDSELNLMFGQSVPRVPLYPEWHSQERPESIVTVLDQEVSARPYVSPSQQELLDKQAAEAERIRRLLMADDFRERALLRMMDGVLEVRWEDIIKIDVPKPGCMLEKTPEEYTADDIIRVKQYEKDVLALQEERERYRRILEAEYARIGAVLQEGVDRFDRRLDQLLQLKVNVDAAINQMNLRYVRGCVRNFHRVESLEEQDRIKKKISMKIEQSKTLSDQLQRYKTFRNELLGQCDSMSGRERTMFKKFRAEFAPLGKSNFEILERLYKRRPRASLRNVSSSELIELCVHVIGQTQVAHLPDECLDYLRGLESLDHRPNSVPASLEPHWAHFVRLRRQRIEYELKLKAKQAEIGETEKQMSMIQRRIEECEDETRRTKEELEEARIILTRFEQDLEIQLVLKMGQIEIDLHGDRTDFDRGILVSQFELDSVNSAIRAAGSFKVDAFRRSLRFHRGTLTKEFEHRCLRKRVQDLEDDLRLIQLVTVTKEMQEHLKRVHRGLRDDWNQLRLEQQINAEKSLLGRMLDQHRTKSKEIEAEIERRRAENARMDREIFALNVARCEFEHDRDPIAEGIQRSYLDRRMRLIVARSDLIRRIQDNYAKLLALQTEHELCRLRRFPVLEFRTIDTVQKKNLS